MSQSDPGDEYADALAFLRERLDRGNDCLLVGNARGAINYYESALISFAASNRVPVLRGTYRALWNNKAMAHQQLREFVKAQEAMMIANSLIDD